MDTSDEYLPAGVENLYGIFHELRESNNTLAQRLAALKSIVDGLQHQVALIPDLQAALARIDDGGAE